MHRANQIMRCVLFVMPLLLRGQPPDLTPLLPPPSESAAVVRRLVVSGDLAGAAGRVAALTPGEQQLWRGILAILGNDPTTAIRALRYGQYPKALGVAYYLARQYGLFRQQMDKAIALDPADFGPYYYYGRHYDSDLDNCEQAVEWFRKALVRNPAYARARAFLGGCLERQSQPVEAEREYRASLAVPLSLLGLGRLKLASGSPAEALPWVEKAVAAEPRNAAGQKVAARVYEALGRRGEAIRALEAAAQSTPYDASIHYQLYRLHRSGGNEPKAAAALREFERVRSIYGSQPQ